MKGGRKPRLLVRPHIRELHGYVPGEQLRVRGLVKLNTNENPYGPAPGVLRAMRAAVDGRMRLYPNPTAGVLREELARLHGCRPTQVLVGNGSDEILALATRAFVEPVGGRGLGLGSSKSRVQALDPSYSLYPVLAAIQGAEYRRVPLGRDFSLPAVGSRGAGWDRDAALTIITTPNAPSGRGYRTVDLEGVVQRLRGVVILDEAYADFAPENAMRLGLEYPHVLVARTFSKAYSLCFQRVGYVVGNEELIGALDRIRDSYNVNGLGQVAAVETLRHRGYYRVCHRRIVRTRGRLGEELSRLGFEVWPSAANFLLVRPPGPPAEEWAERLRGSKILVRWFGHPRVRECLRITVGTDGEVDRFLSVVSGWVRLGWRGRG